MVGAGRRAAEAGRPLGVLRRLLPGALRAVGTHDRVVDRRKIVNPGTVEKDELVEAVTAKDNGGGHDANDDIIDRVIGHETKKPGDDEGKHADIVVPSTVGQGGQPARR